MENTKIISQENGTVSLQVTHLENITEGFSGNFTHCGLLKNTNEDSLIDVELIMADSNTITTSLSSGWNPELVIGINNAPAGLQLGY